MSDYTLRWDSNTNENIVDEQDTDHTRATPDQVLSGYPYKDSDTRELLFGTMPENEDVSITLAYDSIYQIPRGYHSGNSSIRGTSLKDSTIGTATADDIVFNKVAWINGVRVVGLLNRDLNDQKGTATADDMLLGTVAWVNRIMITGTIPRIERVDHKLLAGDTYTIEKGYHGGTMQIVGVPLKDQTVGNATADDIVYGKTAWVNGILIMGNAVSFNDHLSDATAKSLDIRKGKIAYTTYGKTAGSMEEFVSRPTMKLMAGQAFTIPLGYHDGLWAIQSASLLEQTKADATADDIRKGKTAWVDGVLINGTMIQHFAPNTDATATDLDIKLGKTAWVNGELLTGRNPYTSVPYNARYTNKTTPNTPIIAVIPNHHWNKIISMDVFLYSIADDRLLYEYNYTNFESGADRYEKDGTETISIISNMGNDQVVITPFVKDAYMKVYINNYDIIEGHNQTETTLALGTDVHRAITYSATKFIRSITPPDTGGGLTVIDISEKQDKSILTWYDTTNTTQYWYCNRDIIYMNPDSSFMFGWNRNLTIIDVFHFDTSKVTTMESMFNNCSGLTSLNLSNFNTSNVTNMSSMFWNCPALISLDVSSFDTSNVTNMNGMFFKNRSDALNLSNFNTSKVTTMEDMFNLCGLTSLNVSGFDTSNVTNMNGMFREYQGRLASLDLSSFDTSNVTTMKQMFYYCSLVSLDLSNFDTSKVTNMNSMFNRSDRLTSLNISNFNTSNVAYMTDMFNSCASLTTITYGINFVNTNNSIYCYYKMFFNCPANKPTWTNGTWDNEGTFIKNP